MDSERFVELAKSHAPDCLNKEDFLRNLSQQEHMAKVISGESSINAIVLSVDIRASTILMREAVSPIAFASIVTEFVSAARSVLKIGNGWFDKFTGDGFLAYWPCFHADMNIYIREIGDFCVQTLTFFHNRVTQDLRRNSHVFPAGTGLSIGLDGGSVHFVSVADDLTVIGPAVVGAARMVNVAAPYEIMLNSQIGNYITEHPNEGGFADRFTIERVIRDTKEYPKGQEVYRVILK